MCHLEICVRWTPSNLATLGTYQSVLIRGVRGGFISGRSTLGHFEYRGGLISEVQIRGSSLYIHRAEQHNTQRLWCDVTVVGEMKVCGNCCGIAGNSLKSGPLTCCHLCINIRPPLSSGCFDRYRGNPCGVIHSWC